ncbi:MAG TPA: NADP-dependent oxidoreductase, partial [Chitinophagaceae bacterium]|nr:NADP-dependent oxidoreductase [Chitinophagaceae bacterium]
MKAFILEEGGAPEALQLRQVPEPEPAADELLVRVKAISINPVDVKTRQGKALFAKLKEDGPVILGWDISGEVIRTGPAVTGFSVGQEVFGMVRFPGHGKAYAEYVAAPAGHFALKPSSINHKEAAAATLAALTAWQVLVHQAQVRPGERVLIHAAAGGVGHFAVQIARHLGASVSGTASTANHEFLRRLGAEELIDYRSAAFEEAAAPFDVILDAVGGDHLARSLKALKPGGRLVSILGMPEALSQQATAEGKKAWGYLVQSSGTDMAELSSLLQDGRLRAEVAASYPFADMAEAHRQVETGHTRGKVVVTLNGQ